MEVTFTKVTQRDINFARARRMLVKLMSTLNVRPAKLGQFHAPKNRDGKWTWMLIMDINDPHKKHPMYFTVDQKTLVSQLTVVRKNDDAMLKWEAHLPENLKHINAEEIWRSLGF